MQTIQDPEIERLIGLRERELDIAKNRVNSLILDLDAAERELDRTHFPSRNVLKGKAVSRVERQLLAARETLEEARASVEAAWALRSSKDSKSAKGGNDDSR
jgi:hypothetical protein